MSNHLVPTPIVDKNGVSSTRLKKQDARKHSSALDWLNPVAAIRSGSERRKIAAATQEMLFRYEAPDMRMKLSDAFMKSDDIVFLKNALIAAELVTRNESGTERFTDDHNELVRLLKLHGTNNIDVTTTVNAIAAHRDWLAKGDPDRFNDFVSTLSMVMYPYFPENAQEDGSVRNVEAHCAAYTHFRNWGKHGYIKDPMAMKAVDAHPDDVERVLEFIEARGSDAFSDEVFAGYKSVQPAVADGWL